MIFKSKHECTEDCCYCCCGDLIRMHTLQTGHAFTCEIAYMLRICDACDEDIQDHVSGTLKCLFAPTTFKEMEQ